MKKQELSREDVRYLALKTVVFCQATLGIEWTDTNTPNGEKRKWEDILTGVAKTLPKQFRAVFEEDFFEIYQSEVK